MTDANPAVQETYKGLVTISADEQQHDHARSGDVFFFWEYVHRLLGRVIGSPYASPFHGSGFKEKRHSSRLPQPRYLALMMLGALGHHRLVDGFSGLVRREVAHERLAVHLGTALTIAASCIWTALGVANQASRQRLGPDAVTPAFAIPSSLHSDHLEIALPRDAPYIWNAALMFVLRDLVADSHA
jgi:heme A synthase